MSDDPNFSNPYANMSPEDVAKALEAQANQAPGDGAKQPKVPKAPKVARDLTPDPRNGLCLCGCGHPKRTTESAFLPGHDAKLKSKILKVEDGKLAKSDISEQGWAYAKAKWANIFTSGVLDDNWVYVAPPPKVETPAATV